MMFILTQIMWLMITTTAVILILASPVLLAIAAIWLVEKIFNIIRKNT